MRNSSTASDQAMAFGNVVLTFTDPKTGETCRATLAGFAIRGDERRPSANASPAWRFVQNAKVNCLNKARDLDAGQALEVLNAEAFSKLLKARNLTLSLEVRDARPAAENEEEDSNEQW